MCYTLGRKLSVVSFAPRLGNCYSCYQFVGGFLAEWYTKINLPTYPCRYQTFGKSGGYSFPSGHGMVSATFYGMPGYLLWLNLREHSRLMLSRCVVVFTFALIAAIGM